MGLVDWAVLIYTVFGVANGFIRGLMALLVKLVAIVLATVLTFQLFPRFGGWLANSLNVSDAYSQPVSLTIIFVVLLIGLTLASNAILHLFGFLSRANPFNRAGGAVLGAVESLLVASIALAALVTLPTSDQIKNAVQQSRFGQPLVHFALGLDKSLGKGAHLPGISLGYQVDSGDETVTPLHFTNSNPTEDVEGEVKMALFLDRLRDKNKSSKLTPNPKLQEIAKSHAKDMLAKDYFGHKSPDGVFAGGRVQQSGLIATSVGENLVKAQTVELAQTGLLASSSHRKIMLSSDYTNYGIAIMDSGPNGKIVVQLFAKIQ